MKAWFTLCLALWVVGCDGCGRDESPAAALSASARATSEAGPPAEDVTRRILSAEHRRDAKLIEPDDLTSRDGERRRLAVRALARIADSSALERLEPALADEDLRVVRWAAYGLGYGCRERGPRTVRALVARAASLAADATTPADEGRARAIDAIADALGRCGGPEAEVTLRAWLSLSGAVAESAAFGLGRLASEHKRLDDASIVALLDAAGDPEHPVDAALFPFSRLSTLGETVEARLLDVARDALGRPKAQRMAIRALGRAGAGAPAVLEKVVVDAAIDAPARAEAARELGRLESAGQASLVRALDRLSTKSQLSDDALTGASYGVLLAVLETLSHPAKDATDALERLVALPITQNGPIGLKRRVVRLRCRAASLLAGGSLTRPALSACDPEAHGELGALARIEVLGRAPITGARQRAWLDLAESKNVRVRQAALGLISSHAEIRDAATMLAAALMAKEGGTVATAAQIVASYPDRAAKQPHREDDEGSTPSPPHPKVVESLTAAMKKSWPADAIETRATLMDAAGALQLLSLKPEVEAACKSDNPTLRDHAEKALRLLGERARRCPPKPGTADPDELTKLVRSPVRIVLTTDVGDVSMTLDPEQAPVTVTRVVDLVRAGFYDGVVVHRVVPGFVVQFGDPGGDGYGGAGRPPLRCETSPTRFDTNTVGVALAGRDTGSSQLFVTLGPFPHLDGSYPAIGRAEPGWERLAPGDVIRKARVAE